MLKFCLPFVVLGVVVAYKQVFQQTGSGVSPTYNEEPCNSQGGMCMATLECPKGQLAEPDLCPSQVGFGVSCCYGLPISETRCRHRGGECMKDAHCPPSVTYSQATDCEPDETCCILV